MQVNHLDSNLRLAGLFGTTTLCASPRPTARASALNEASQVRMKAENATLTPSRLRWNTSGTAAFPATKSRERVRRRAGPATTLELARSAKAEASV